MPGDAIAFAGLMPHAPILVPGVGDGHCAKVRETVSAMAAVARRVVDLHPDSVLLISPHSPRRTGMFGVWYTPQLIGSFEEFGSNQGRVALPLDEALAEALEKQARARRLRTWRIAGGTLDHGAAVPLSCLVSAGWNGPTVIVGLDEAGDAGLEELGTAITAAAVSLHRRIAVIASGDMSHRLTPSAPCGYHCDGQRFDDAFVELLRSGNPADIRRMDPTLLDNAGEDAVASTWVAFAATGYSRTGRALLSYEGPFGVGYGVAILFDRGGGPASTTRLGAAANDLLGRCADLPGLARRAVTARFEHGPEEPPFEAAGELAQPHGVFVTLRTTRGRLRGCRGSPIPQDLVRLTWHEAQSAAFDDPRFPPLHAQELPRVRFTVSVLGGLEPVSSPEELNPAVYGILITSVDHRRGLLLPDLAGIRSAAEQLCAAKQKAGIGLDEPVAIQRFTTATFQEPSGKRGA